MQDQPWTIVVDGTGNVTERKLADHYPGTPLTASVTVVSNIVTSGVRTVVLTRALKGISKDHFTFDPTQLAVQFINAVGATPDYSYHQEKEAATLQLWPKQSACVCSVPAAVFGEGSGMFKYIGGGANEPANTPVGETIGMPAGRCAPQPREDLLAQRNPTCDIRTYVGGLLTCHHGWILLDADQEVPWQDQPLEYYKKFRIYFQEYNASFHKQITRQDWGIAADGDHSEYDVIQCTPGTPTAECNHTITGTWMPVPPSEPDMHLVLAHHHCHAPTCLRMELWNNDTGKLLCRQEPVYGGTNKIDLPDYDEPGYIAMPPCMWGSPEHGLEHPPLVSGVTIKVVHITNSTFGHHGEMALPEMSLVKGPF